MSELIFSYKLFNPLFWHIRDAMRNPDIRYIFNRGGSSSGKSVSTAQAVALSVFSGEGSALVIRKVSTSLKNTVYEEFKVQIRKLCLARYFTFKENTIVCYNGLKIDFTGLDDPEKIKSITNYRWVVMEETTDFEYEDFTQVRFRLRGKPGLQIICNFNPTSEDLWIKTKILDTYKWNTMPCDMFGKARNSITGKPLGKEYSTITSKRSNVSQNIFNERTGKSEEYKPDTLELHSTYRNNFWVVGSPDGKYGYYDKQTIANYLWYKDHDYNFYRVYALGEWGSIKTGGEFLNSFDSNRHITQVKYNNEYPVHISIDNNVLPYISMTFYQYEEDRKQIRQFHEICAEDPFNTVTKAAELAVEYLKTLSYDNVLYLYGDASTKAGNTIDEEKRSFLDKFIETLQKNYQVEERIPDSNPSVAMTGAFVNYILSNGGGMSFVVDDSCRNSITDYNNAKKDVNGGMLKTKVKNKATGQSYEKYGHICDTLRYVIYQIFKNEYIDFSLSRKRSSVGEDELIHYKPDFELQGVRLCYLLPQSEGRAVLLRCIIGEYIYIKDILYTTMFDDEAFIKGIQDHSPEKVIVECSNQYKHFLSDLRGHKMNVWGIKDNANVDERITAYINYSKRCCRFNPDYNFGLGYHDFINDLLDYPSSRKSAMNALCALVSYCIRSKIFPHKSEHK